MPTLTFPIVSQLTTVTGDGKPSENAAFDCVAACVDAMCRYWLKQPENSVFNPDHFKDAAYGENWKNDGTDAARYVAFCHALGINLHMVSASNAAEVLTLAQDFISKGIPCLFTERDPYVDTNLPQYAGWTHACCFFGFDAGGLTALDPYIGKPVYKSMSSWIEVLRSPQLWLAEKIVMLPANWSDDGHTLKCPTGEAVLGFRAHILPRLLDGSWEAGDYIAGKQFSNPRLELSNAELGGGDQLLTFKHALAYPHNPTGGAASLKETVIEEYVGKELDACRRALQEEYTKRKAAEAQVAALQAQVSQGSITPQEHALLLQFKSLAQEIQ